MTAKKVVVVVPVVPVVPFFKRRKSCPFSSKNAPAIDYKDPKLLGRFVSERGKMVPSRITAVSQKAQRKLAARNQACTLPWL